MLRCLLGSENAYWPTLNEMRCWTSWRTGWPLNLAGLKTPFRIASLAGSANAGCVVFEHLEGVRLGVAGGVHDVLQVDRPGDPGALQHRRIARRRDGDRLDRIVQLRLQEHFAGHRAGAAHDAGRDAALDALTREVLRIEGLLVQVDRRNVLGDVGRRHHRLEPLGRRVRGDDHVRRRLVRRRLGAAPAA